MIYPDADVNEWAAKWGIDLKPANCAKCGVEIYFTQPIAAKNWRGVQTNHTSCGEGYRQAILRPIGEDLKLFAAIMEGSADE